jgi:hypothetical protein
LKVDDGWNGVPVNVADTLSGLAGARVCTIKLEAIALTKWRIVAPERLQPILT